MSNRNLRDEESYFLPYDFVDDIENDNKNINQYQSYSDYSINGEIEDEDYVDVGSDINKIVNKFKSGSINQNIKQKHKLDGKRKRINNRLIFNKQKEDFDDDEKLNNSVDDENKQNLFNDTDKEYLIYGIVVGIVVIFIANLIHKIK